MEYTTIQEARFLTRPNRFVARVALNGAEETVHVKNTGRCRELLAQLGNPDTLVLVAEDTAIKVKDLLPYYWQDWEYAGRKAPAETEESH